MDHLTDAELSDCARGLLAPEKRPLLQSHLAQCGRCGGTVAFYEKVTAAAFTAPLLLPVELVAEAKALFKSNQSQENLVTSLAQRIFPSGPSWALAGVRSAMQSGAAKHAVYESGDFSVDLRSEIQANTVRISLVGQLANRSEPQKEFEAVQVRLVAGKKTLEHTECNRLGEFAFSFTPVRGLNLEIDLPAPYAQLKVPLRDLSHEETTR